MVEKISPLCLCLIFLAMADNAWAYIDPGTGSHLLQIVAALVVGSLFALKTFWHRLKAFFRGGKDDSDGDDA